MKRDIYATAVARFEDARSFVFKDGREQLCGYDWKMRKLELFKRCEGRCEYIRPNGFRCLCDADDPHHLTPRRIARDDRLENLIGICRVCHSELDKRKIRSDKKERR
jgi:hypothetical protein